MGSIGTAEVLIILVVALLVLGPERLPETARQVGRFVAEIRRMSAGMQAEIRDALQEPVPSYPPATSPPPAGGDGSPQRWSDLPPAGPADGAGPAPQ